MIFNILNNKSLPVYGNGKNIREWIYVKDNCEALLKIFLRGKSGKNYNIGTGIKLKNIDIVKKLLEAAKKNKIILILNEMKDDENFTGDYINPHKSSKPTINAFVDKNNKAY